MADYRAEYRNWCDNTYFDEDTRREVKEPLYGKEGDTGTCKLYEPSELYGKKGGNRL